MREGIARYDSTRRMRLVAVVAILLIALLPQSLLAAPAEVNASPQASGYTTHIVQAGESLSAIAARYGVSLQALITTNNIANPNHIFVGQRLRIPTGQQQPGAAQPSGCSQTHNVVAGETLSGLAVQYGVTIQSLAQANNTSVTSFVFIGQQLCIPSSSSGGGGTSGGGTGTSTGGFWYEVQIGDTLSRIAFNNGSTITAIMQANNFTNPNTVFWARGFGFRREEQARRLLLWRRSRCNLRPQVARTRSASRPISMLERGRARNIPWLAH